jgi:hypothetical protein
MATGKLTIVSSLLLVAVAVAGLSGYLFAGRDAPAAPAPAAPVPAVREKSDKEKLQGTWRVATVERGGEPDGELTPKDTEFDALERRCFEQGAGLREEYAAPIYPGVLNEATPEGASPGHAGQLWQRAHPRLCVTGEQRPLPLLQCRPLRVARGHSGQFALHADELGPLGPPVVLQPIGVDEPRGVVVGVVPDRTQ